MRVISAKFDAAEWDLTFSRLPEGLRDVHFTSAYGRVQQTIGGEAFCAIEEFVDGEFIMQPFMRYRITGTNFFELKSMYGFGGPIGNVVEEDAPNRGRVFAQGLRAWARQTGVVSEYCRPHPLYAHYQLPLLREENLTFFKDTICIDNLQGLTEIGVSRRIRRALRRARPDHLVVQLLDHGADNFKPLYDAAMQRLGAEERWRHDLGYWEAHGPEVGARWYFVYDNAGVAHRALLTVGLGKVAYAHFLGSSGEHRAGGGLDELLYFDVARDLAQRGFERLYLGGGLSGEEDDSLLMFKSGFSDARYSVGYFQRVFQPDVHEELVA